MLSKFSVKKPLTIFVAIIIVIALGFISYTKMTVDLIPEFELPYAVVMTSYPGASPEEVEMVVTNSLEQSLSTLSNLAGVTSTSSEHFSMVMLEFNGDTNMDTATIDIRESIDMVKSYLPDEVGSPMIMKLNPSMMPTFVFALTVDGMSKTELSKFVDSKVYPEIKSVNGVAAASMTGLVENLIDVTISAEKISALESEFQQTMMEMAMQQAQVNLEKSEDDSEKADVTDTSIATPEIALPIEINEEYISNILKGQNFQMPSGSVIDSDNNSYLLRVGDKIGSIEELENLVVMQIPGMGSVRLEDVANITVYDNSNLGYSKMNGENGVAFTIQKQPDVSTSKLSEALYERLDEIKGENEGFDYSVFMDQGEYIDLMMNAIISNLIYGGIFAIIILFFFLRKISPTIIVGASIIIGVITAFVLMYFTGVTLNMISMGGLALGVGMLVDNSIVVIENIYRLRAEGKTFKEAAFEGANEVSGAIIASTLTTVVVFVPIIFTQGLTKQLFSDLALTITFSLLASLVVALTLVPASTSLMGMKEQKRKENIIDKLSNFYSKALEKSLKFKFVTVLLVVVLFGVSIFAVLGSGIELFPVSDTGQVMLQIEIPEKFTNEEKFEVYDEIGEKVSQIKEVSMIGIMQSSEGDSQVMGFASGSTMSYLMLEEERTATTEEIGDEIVALFEDREFKVVSSSAGMDMTMLTGSPVSIQVFGQETQNLTKTAKDISNIVASVVGTTDVDNGLGDINKDLKIVVDKEIAIAKGLTVAQVYMAVSEATSNAKSITTIKDGVDEFDIFVKSDSDAVYTDESIKDLEIMTPLGEAVKLSDVATIDFADGLTSISHQNQERTVTISASLMTGYDVKDVNDKISVELEKYEISPDCRYEIGGEMQSISETFGDLFLMIGLAIGLIYLVMVAQFQSLKSPFIVMFTIPLAFTGGFAALFLTGTKVSVISLIGLLVLVGIVVNNGIVFVDYANQQIQKGMTVKGALVITGKNRLRPILMTALTTIIALLMMAFDTSTGSEMLKPLAITTIGGLFYATILTLFFVPAMYSIFHKDKNTGFKSFND